MVWRRTGTLTSPIVMLPLQNGRPGFPVVFLLFGGGVVSRLLLFLRGFFCHGRLFVSWLLQPFLFPGRGRVQRIFCLLSKMSLHGSSCLESTVFILKSSGRTPCRSSSHRSGVETVASAWPGGCTGQPWSCHERSGGNR